MKTEVMNIPNLISLTRLALGLLIAVLIYKQWFGWALALFIVCCISDGADGFFARYLSQETKLGAELDAFANKVLINASVIALTLIGEFPLWFCLTILCRDIGIVAGYFVLKILKRVPSTKAFGLGKITTPSQLGVIIFTIWTNFQNAQLEKFIPIIAIICAGLTLLSAASYLISFVRNLTHKA